MISGSNIGFVCGISWVSMKKLIVLIRVDRVVMDILIIRVVFGVMSVMVSKFVIVVFGVLIRLGLIRWFCIICWIIMLVSVKFVFVRMVVKVCGI